MKETERMRALREAARVAAQSREAPTSNCYAIAREIWGLWWKEAEAQEPAATFFACGPGKCIGGREHEWGAELLPIPGYMNAESVCCVRCKIPKMCVDMWSEP